MSDAPVTTIAPSPIIASPIQDQSAPVPQSVIPVSRTLILSSVVGIIMSLILCLFLPLSFIRNGRQFVSSTLLQRDSIELDASSSTATSIVVSHVRVNKSGFIVIRRISDFDSPSDVLGTSRFLYAGEFYNLTIPIEPNTGSQSAPVTKVIAGLYEDTGDGQLDLSVDAPIQSIFGDPVFVIQTLK